MKGGGDFAEATCVSFYYCDNGLLTAFYIVFLIVPSNESSDRLGFCLLKLGINRIVYNQNIEKRDGLGLTNTSAEMCHM